MNLQKQNTLERRRIPPLRFAVIRKCAQTTGSIATLNRYASSLSKERASPRDSVTLIV